MGLREARTRPSSPTHPTPVPYRPDLCRWGPEVPTSRWPGWGTFAGRIASDQVLFSLGPNPLNSDLAGEGGVLREGC